MSTTAHIKIDLDANKANKELKDTNKGIKELNKTVKETTKNVLDLDASFDEVYKGIKPLTTQLGENEDKLYQLALAGKQTSKEYQTLLKAVGNYRKTQIQTDMAVDAAALTITQKLTTGLGAAAGGFAVVEGAMAAAGMESAAFEQTMQRLAGVMAVLQGINELRESLPLLQQMFGGFAGGAANAEALGEAMAGVTDNTAEYVSSATETVSATTDIIQSSKTAEAANKTQAAANQILAATQQEVNAAKTASVNPLNSATAALRVETLALEDAIKAQELYNMTGMGDIAVIEKEIIARETKIASIEAEIAALKASEVSNTKAFTGIRKYTVATDAASQSVKVLAKETAISAAATLGIVAVAAAAAFGIYKLVKALSAEDAQSKKNREDLERLNKERKYQQQLIKESAEFIANESAEFVGLIQALKNTNAQSEERSRLIADINAQYGTTLQNLSDEYEFQAQLNKGVQEYIALQYNKFKLQKNEEYFTAALEKRFAAEQEMSRLVRNNTKFYETYGITTGTAAEKLTQYRNKNLEFNAAMRAQEDIILDADIALEKLGLRKEQLINVEDDLTDGGKKYTKQTKESTKAVKDNTTEVDKFAERLKTLGNVFTGFAEGDPEAAFGYLDTLGPKILQAETEINRKRLEITGTYGNERLALEEQLRQAELALLDLQLEQELKMAGANTDEKLKIESEYALKRYDILSKSSAQVSDLDADEVESKKTWLEMDLNERISLVQSYVEKVAEIASQATDVIATFNENAFASQQAEMDSYYEQQALQLEGSLANQKISQEQYDSDVREIDQRRREDQKRLDKEAFERSKKIQIANATIAGAQAVLNAFASGVATPLVGPATGAIYAAIAAAFSAVQIGQIKAQPFTAARGGIVPGVGSGRVDTVNAMLAPGEAVINAQSTGAFLPVLNAINQLGGGKPLVATQNSQVTQIAGYQQPNEIRAYVVERDMTEAQSRSARAKRNARLFR